MDFREKWEVKHRSVVFRISLFLLVPLSITGLTRDDKAESCT